VAKYHNWNDNIFSDEINVHNTFTTKVQINYISLGSLSLLIGSLVSLLDA